MCKLTVKRTSKSGITNYNRLHHDSEILNLIGPEVGYDKTSEAINVARKYGNANLTTGPTGHIWKIESNSGTCPL